MFKENGLTYIGIDLSSIWRPGGISDYRVARGLLEGLRAIRNEHDHRIIIAVDSSCPAEEQARIPFEIVRYRGAPRVITNTLSLRRAYEKAGVQSALFHHFGPWSFAGKSVVLIHDVIPETHPETFDRRTRHYMNSRKPFAKRSDIILTVSEYSKRQLIALGYSSPSNTEIIRWGADDSISEPTAVVLPQDLKGRAFCLVVGRMSSRKRPVMIAKAHGRLKNTGGVLVFVGPLDDPAIVQAVRQVPDVLVLGQVGDAMLEDLYRRASFVVAASKVEGFGMPIVEALARGVPVVAANIEAFVEIGQDFQGCRFYEGDSVESLECELDRAWRDVGSIAFAVDAEKARSHFSWSASARNLLRVLST